MDKGWITLMIRNWVGRYIHAEKSCRLLRLIFFYFYWNIQLADILQHFTYISLSVALRVYWNHVLTIQKEACVWAPKFVDGDTSVVAVISIRHIKKRQLRQWSSIHNFHAIKAIEDPRWWEKENVRGQTMNAANHVNCVFFFKVICHITYGPESSNNNLINNSDQFSVILMLIWLTADQ